MLCLARYNDGFVDGVSHVCSAIRSLQPENGFNLNNALTACETACDTVLKHHIPKNKELIEEVQHIKSTLNDTYMLLRDLYSNLITEEGNYIPEDLRKRVEKMFKSFNDTQN